MQSIFKQIKHDHTTIAFKAADTFKWSPSNQTVCYEEQAIDEQAGMWSLLHEVGHALLKHDNYKDDFQLLIMEVAAWREAQKLAESYGLHIAESHIDDCLESYRNWLHTRSRCLECKTHSFQEDLTTYRCHNCLTRWTVPASRMCHARRIRL